MKIFEKGEGLVAHAQTVIIGRKFLFGEVPVEISGYAIAAEPGQFVRALREGDTYFVEDAGSHWRLRLVALRHAEGHIIGGRPVNVPKEGSAKA